MLQIGDKVKANYKGGSMQYGVISYSIIFEKLVIDFLRYGVQTKDIQSATLVSEEEFDIPLKDYCKRVIEKEYFLKLDKTAFQKLINDCVRFDIYSEAMIKSLIKMYKKEHKSEFL